MTKTSLKSDDELVSKHEKGDVVIPQSTEEDQLSKNTDNQSTETEVDQQCTEKDQHTTETGQHTELDQEETEKNQLSTNTLSNLEGERGDVSDYTLAGGLSADNRAFVEVFRVLLNDRS